MEKRLQKRRINRERRSKDRRSKEMCKDAGVDRPPAYRGRWFSSGRGKYTQTAFFISRLLPAQPRMRVKATEVGPSLWSGSVALRGQENPSIHGTAPFFAGPPLVREATTRYTGYRHFVMQMFRNNNFIPLSQHVTRTVLNRPLCFACVCFSVALGGTEKNNAKEGRRERERKDDEQYHRVDASPEESKGNEKIRISEQPVANHSPANHSVTLLTGA